MCDPLARFSWIAMVARVGTVTAAVARLSEMLRTSCGLIWVCVGRCGRVPVVAAVGTFLGYMSLMELCSCPIVNLERT